MPIWAQNGQNYRISMRFQRQLICDKCLMLKNTKNSLLNVSLQRLLHWQVLYIPNWIFRCSYFAIAACYIMSISENQLAVEWGFSAKDEYFMRDWCESLTNDACLF
jgi:hypothetical protein